MHYPFSYRIGTYFFIMIHESWFMGDFPNKYTRYCFEFGEYYDHRPWSIWAPILSRPKKSKGEEQEQIKTIDDYMKNKFENILIY